MIPCRLHTYCAWQLHRYRLVPHNQLHLHLHLAHHPLITIHHIQVKMPRAEVGTLKHLNNRQKSKGLQRLRWYCQVCERQMRDDNGFKCHAQSESHVRQMLLVGEDPRKHIQDFSNQFERDFKELLRTAHGEKPVNVNHFYQEYIANKEHVHMNATQWPSLTDFAKHLGRKGICRVEETEKGWMISWIDDSPAALKRQAATLKKERQDRGEEEREQRAIREQVERAKHDAEQRRIEDEGDTGGVLAREDGERIKLNLQPGAKMKGGARPSGGAGATPGPSQAKASSSPPLPEAANSETETAHSKDSPRSDAKANSHTSAVQKVSVTPSIEPTVSIPPTVRLSSSVSKSLTPTNTGTGTGVKPPKKNVFAAAAAAAAASAKAKQTPSGNASKTVPQKRPMSEAERIMKGEIERRDPKRLRGGGGGGGGGGPPPGRSYH